MLSKPTPRCIKFSTSTKPNMDDNFRPFKLARQRYEFVQILTKLRFIVGESRNSSLLEILQVWFVYFFH